jgi:hypothetical protein
MRSAIVIIVVVGGLVAALAVLLMIRRREEPPREGNIRIVARLDEFTKGHPNLDNSIPSFLAGSGTLGIVPVQANAEAGASRAQPALTTRDVKPLEVVELEKGICTAVLTRLVRQQYPGEYDSIPDAQLEKIVLQKRPEYRGRLCAFPVWITADPHEIVKYEVLR